MNPGRTRVMSAGDFFAAYPISGASYYRYREAIRFVPIRPSEFLIVLTTR